METKIKYETYKANLEKINDDKWQLCLCLDQISKINLSEDNQDYLKEVFNTLIKKMIDDPFYFIFIESIEEDAKGLNEICEKYISILNNDLKGVYEEYLNSLNDIIGEDIK